MLMKTQGKFIWSTDEISENDDFQRFLGNLSQTEKCHDMKYWGLTKT